MKNKKIKLVVFVIIIVIVYVIINKNNLMENIERNIKAEEEPKIAELFTYTMYDNQNDDKSAK